MNAMRMMAAGVFAVALVAGVQAAEKADTNKEKIVGVWEVVKADEGALPVGSVIDFGKDGKMKVTAKRGDKVTTSEGTYTVDGDKLNVTLKVEDKERKLVITIKKLTATEYVAANNEGKVSEYKRKK